MSDVLVLRNHFNGETFTFPPETHGSAARFACELEPGGSGGGDGLLHVHPVACETFQVTQGCLGVTIDNIHHLVRAGECVIVRPGQRHRFRNESPGRTNFVVEFTPAQRHREFFMTFARLTDDRPSWFSPSGKPNLLLTALMLHRFSGHLYLAHLPIWLQRAAFALLARVAVLLGYELQAADPSPPARTQSRTPRPTT